MTSQSPTNVSLPSNTPGRVGQACKETALSEAVWWQLGSMLMYVNQPDKRVIEFNLADTAVVVAVTAAKGFSRVIPGLKNNRVVRFLDNNIHPTAVQVAFWGANTYSRTRDYLELAPNVDPSMLSDTRTQALYAGINLAFYLSTALEGNKHFVNWREKQSKLMQGVLRTEFINAPCIPVFYGHYIDKIGDALGVMHVGSHNVTVITASLTCLAGGVVLNSIVNAVKPEQSPAKKLINFFSMGKMPERVTDSLSKNFGMASCVALNAIAQCQPGEPGLTRAFLGLFMTGTILYCLKDYWNTQKKSGLSAADVGTPLKAA